MSKTDKLIYAYLDWVIPKLVRAFGPWAANLAAPIAGFTVVLIVWVPIVLILYHIFV